MPDELPVRCSVRDGLFVEPCDALSKAIDNNIPGFSKVKGIFIRHLTNIETRLPSRSYVGIKTKAIPNGMLFNCCPFCCEDISAPFTEKTEPAPSDAWQRFAGDFNAFTDEEADAEAEEIRDRINEDTEWVEAHALWVAAGRPRGPIA